MRIWHSAYAILDLFSICALMRMISAPRFFQWQAGNFTFASLLLARLFLIYRAAQDYITLIVGGIKLMRERSWPEYANASDDTPFRQLPLIYAFERDFRLLYF